jgi:hypothetical protein
MVRVKHTVRPRDDIPASERDLSGGDKGNNQSANGIGTIRVGDVGSQSQSNNEGDSAEGS